MGRGEWFVNLPSRRTVLGIGEDSYFWGWVEMLMDGKEI